MPPASEVGACQNSRIPLRYREQPNRPGKGKEAGSMGWPARRDDAAQGASAVRGEAVPPFVAVPNRGMITLSIMMANIMQGVANSILNIALPHIQGSLSASLDQIAWALTSYIVCAAIMMPLTGWLAGRFGIKYIFLVSVIRFTFVSARCGPATSLAELVLFRALQVVAGAGLIPQATLLQINPPERHGYAM